MDNAVIDRAACVAAWTRATSRCCVLSARRSRSFGYRSGRASTTFSSTQRQRRRNDPCTNKPAGASEGQYTASYARHRRDCSSDVRCVSPSNVLQLLLLLLLRLCSVSGCSSIRLHLLRHHALLPSALLCSALLSCVALDGPSLHPAPRKDARCAGDDARGVGIVWRRCRCLRSSSNIAALSVPSVRVPPSPRQLLPSLLLLVSRS